MDAYVIGGWGAAAGIIVLYSWRTLRRGRLLGRRLPPRAPSSTEAPWR